MGAVGWLGYAFVFQSEIVQLNFIQGEKNENIDDCI